MAPLSSCPLPIARRCRRTSPKSGTAVDSGAHAALVLDQTGRHVSTRLVVPDNITLLPLAPRSPGAEPRRERLAVHAPELLSNRVFESCDHIVTHYCDSWSKLTEALARPSVSETGHMGFDEPHVAIASASGLPRLDGSAP